MPVKTEINDLFLTAKQDLENKKININLLNEADFNLRNNNLWENLIYYKLYSDKLKSYFGVSNSKLPVPSYPLISNILKKYTGYQILPPINLVEIATFLRKNLGSGITIRTKDKAIESIDLSKKTNSEILNILLGYKNKLGKRYILELEGTKKKKPYLKTIYTNYKDFPQFNLVLKQLKKANISLTSINLYKNKELNPKKNNQKDSSRILLAKEYVKGLDDKEILNLTDDLKGKIANIHTVTLSWKDGKKTKQTKFLIRFDNYPRFDRLLNKKKYLNIKFDKLVLTESKVLKHKPNSREVVDFSQLPDKIRKSYILVEDDYFYFQAGGIDPIGLIRATYNYVILGKKKGNASIIEQIYEMYLGKQKKNPFDKLVQILGANYYSYYSQSRDPYVSLYAQSVPGSFWRDHNYGIKGIVKNYLDKDSLEDLTLKEIAWLTRIALLPNVFGQDYIRFHILKYKLRDLGVNILNKKEVSKFVQNTPKEKRYFIRITSESSESDIDVIERLKRSFTMTNTRINFALRQFKEGNEFIKPLITEEQYKAALKEEIQFNPSKFVNEYQVYTDQSRRDLYQLVGAWSLNAGFDVEVDFDENAQKILEKELLHSTRTVYNYRYDQYAEHKRYGGAAVLVKTNNINSGNVVNKIVAIASKHTEKPYFNWAVNGDRHFGSIYKWVALLLYLDGTGTLLDTFYDIPRTFKYESVTSKGETITRKYKPDNWRQHRDDTYGFFTFDRRNNIYNFIQSKNNTFVEIADRVSLKKLSDFLNEVAGVNKIKNERLRNIRSFKPIYPIVLGSHEASSITFAQINAIISNKGTHQPLTTINRIIKPNGSSLVLNLKPEQKQVVSREAAEAAFFCGYLNTYFGTAKRFISGGAGKTGSSDTDVAFLAMTGRTEKEYIKEDPDHLLNNNLLYLINIGVNVGKIDEGLFGGTVAATNAKAVFEDLLEYKYSGRVKKPKYKISGDFTKYFSKKFKYVKVPGYRIKGKVIQAPILKDKKVFHEKTISMAKLDEIQSQYMIEKDEIAYNEYASELAKTDGKIFSNLSEAEKNEYQQIAEYELDSSTFDEHYSDSDSETGYSDYSSSSSRNRTKKYLKDFERKTFTGESKKKNNSDTYSDSYYDDNAFTNEYYYEEQSQKKAKKNRIIRIESESPDEGYYPSENDFMDRLENDIKNYDKEEGR